MSKHITTYGMKMLRYKIFRRPTDGDRRQLAAGFMAEAHALLYVHNSEGLFPAGTTLEVYDSREQDIILTKDL